MLPTVGVSRLGSHRHDSRHGPVTGPAAQAAPGRETDRHWAAAAPAPAPGDAVPIPAAAGSESGIGNGHTAGLGRCQESRPHGPIPVT